MVEIIRYVNGFRGVRWVGVVGEAVGYSFGRILISISTSVKRRR